MSVWDRRQLVAARGKLYRAHRQAVLAIERLDNASAEPELRALFAIREAEDALVDLRRFVHRKTPA